ncbi:MAG: DUF4479 and tRNA-binding domain-containing protein [Mycoplasma sp.]|nr:DUF4479 and tRNA-binding domain-containing protein [Mycoplasma sp.]
MALIYWNKNTLQDQAILCLKESNENIKIEKKDTYTLIKSKNEIIGINIKNASNFLKLNEGANTITEEIKNLIQKNLGVDLSNYDLENKLYIGKIIKRIKHPKSDKLFILNVEADEKLQIVTNTTNSLEGKFIVVAKIGALLPSGIRIKPTKIMGIESQGMICGEETLGIGKKDGAYLPIGVKEGQKFTL